MSDSASTATEYTSGHYNYATEILLFGDGITYNDLLKEMEENFDGDNCSEVVGDVLNGLGDSGQITQLSDGKYYAPRKNSLANFPYTRQFEVSMF